MAGCVSLHCGCQLSCGGPLSGAGFCRYYEWPGGGSCCFDRSAAEFKLTSQHAAAGRVRTETVKKLPNRQPVLEANHLPRRRQNIQVISRLSLRSCSYSFFLFTHKLPTRVSLPRITPRKAVLEPRHGRLGRRHGFPTVGKS